MVVSFKYDVKKNLQGKLMIVNEKNRENVKKFEWNFSHIIHEISAVRKNKIKDKFMVPVHSA